MPISSIYLNELPHHSSIIVTTLAKRTLQMNEQLTGTFYVKLTLLIRFRFRFRHCTNFRVYYH